MFVVEYGREHASLRPAARLDGTHGDAIRGSCATYTKFGSLRAPAAGASMASGVVQLACSLHCTTRQRLRSFTNILHITYRITGRIILVVALAVAVFPSLATPSRP